MNCPRSPGWLVAESVLQPRSSDFRTQRSSTTVFRSSLIHLWCHLHFIVLSLLWNETFCFLLKIFKVSKAGAPKSTWCGLLSSTSGSGAPPWLYINTTWRVKAITHVLAPQQSNYYTSESKGETWEKVSFFFSFKANSKVQPGLRTTLL